MQKLAIIGASYLQLPLIEKAKQLGYETHVFAWAADDVGEKAADVFYPISIVEKEEILSRCREIGICGICSIASDLAMVTVNYVAHHLGLVGNTLEATENSTNKYRMRQCFFAHGIPSPASIHWEEFPARESDFRYPLIVKPADRSGSRGISEVFSADELEQAVDFARQESFSGEVLVEEFARGSEYSIECISWKGNHTLLAITEKFTTGAPRFVEVGHLQPARLSPETAEKIREITFLALNSLGLEYGASHTELKIDGDGSMKIIEVGGRMGGDTIGSSMVEISTGVDFVRSVIDVAVGREPELYIRNTGNHVAVHFIFGEDDVKLMTQVCRDHPEFLVGKALFTDDFSGRKSIQDSSERLGYFLLKSSSPDDLTAVLKQGYRGDGRS